jgi:signal transduction histidine kinase
MWVTGVRTRAGADAPGLGSHAAGGIEPSVTGIKRGVWPQRGGSGFGMTFVSIGMDTPRSGRPAHLAESGERRSRSPVQAKVIVFLCLVCLMLVSLDVEQSWTAREGRMREARIEANNLARSLAQHAEDVFETTDAEVRTLRDTVADEGVGAASIDRLERRMRAQVANQPLFHTLFLFDEHGDWLASSHSGAELERVRHNNYAGYPFFRFHRDHPDDVALIGPPVRSDVDGIWLVTLTRRVSHPDGRFAGIVGASIPLNLFQRFLETFDVGKRGAISLTSSQGTLFARMPFEAGLIGRSIGAGEFFQRIDPTAVSGSTEFTSLLDGTHRLGGFRRVTGFDLMMIVAPDVDEVLAPWWRETTVHLLWMAIVIMVMLFLGYRLMLQIRTRVAAEAAARTLQLEADQRRRSEAERTAHARELERQKNELERSNAALEQFAYAASHDLQSPLRAISHLAQWIDEAMRPIAPAETLEHLQLMTGRVERMQMLIRGMLAYARVGRGDRGAEDVDLAALVRDVATLVSAPSGFVIGCAGDMPVIHSYRAPLDLVLKNLIGNAVQHHDRAEGRIMVSMRMADGMAEIRVRDDGPGIEARYHEEIFGLFRTLRSRDDTEHGGMGLAMVKKQVTENGGRIWVESTPPDRGCAFVFTWRLGAL